MPSSSFTVPLFRIVHGSLHVPALHTWPLVHEVLQPPQCMVSVISFTHEPVQLVSPCWHDSWHIPFEQTLPCGHALPHIPQLARSVCRLTHTLLHAVSPCWQESLHLPAAHV